jgi:Icc protein
VTRITGHAAACFVEFERMSAIRVIQFTDPHLFGEAAGTLRGVNTAETLERALGEASGHVAICDAILVTGDLVQDDAGGYDHFRRVFARFGKPVLCIPGNHDQCQASQWIDPVAPKNIRQGHPRHY